VWWKKETIIVPPTYNKKYLEGPVLKSIWDFALNEIVESRHIIFCGYSFPEADSDIKAMLKSAELDKSSKLEKVTLVNHFGDEAQRREAKYLTLKDQECNRFSRFFKCEVIDSNKSFQEFVENIDEILEY